MRRLHLEWMGSEGAGSVWKSRGRLRRGQRGADLWRWHCWNGDIMSQFHWDSTVPQIVCVDFDPWFIPGSTGWGPLGRGEADERGPWGASRSKEL